MAKLETEEKTRARTGATITPMTTCTLNPLAERMAILRDAKNIVLAARQAGLVSMPAPAQPTRQYKLPDWQRRYNRAWQHAHRHGLPFRWDKIRLINALAATPGLD